MEDDDLLAQTDPDTSSTPSTELERMFQEHHGRVYGTALRVTGSAQDAEDVLQTVFLRLLRLGDRDLAPSPGSYLQRAAVNAGLDLLRARSRSRSLPLDDLDLPSQGEPAPERRQQDRELRRGLRQAISSLSPKSAEIFTLRYLEETPNRDIAAALGMSQTAVGVALHRARNQVKKELATLVGGN